MEDTGVGSRRDDRRIGRAPGTSFPEPRVKHGFELPLSHPGPNGCLQIPERVDGDGNRPAHPVHLLRILHKAHGIEHLAGIHHGSWAQALAGAPEPGGSESLYHKLLDA